MSRGAEQDYELPWTLLQTLPGTGPLAAAALLAEVGDGMEAFGTARRLASWVGICPGNHESAGKSKGGKRRKGNVYLRRILCEIAHAAARTRGVQFGPYKQQLVKRRGAGRAVVATAHKILRIVFASNRSAKPVFCTGNADRYSLWSRPWRVGPRKRDRLPKGLRCPGGRAGGGCMSRRSIVPRRRKRGRKR